jgi:hypothetical protein
MDTGAAQSVAPPSFACHLPLREKFASRRGAEFQTADGGRIANQGRRSIPSYRQQGKSVVMEYEVTDVVKPLNAVTHICDKGNTVTFTSEGGWIWNEETNNYTEFGREEGVYVLETWAQLRPNEVNSLGFTRRDS